MASQLAVPRAGWKDTDILVTVPGIVDVSGHWTGYGAAELGGGANQYVRLPICFPMDVVLEGVAATAQAWCTGGTAINLSIAKSLYKAANMSGVLGAANRVTEAFDARAAIAPPYLEDPTKIAYGMYDWKIHPSAPPFNNNVIKRGEKLFLHMDAAAATSLTAMFLAMRFSTLLK